MEKVGVILNVQVLRFVAAMLVVIAHGVDFIQSIPKVSYFEKTLAFENVGAVGVDIFFAISGFIITTTAQRGSNAGLFIQHRIYRVLPLYLLCMLPWMVLSVSKGIINSEELFTSLTLWPVVGHAFIFPVLEVGWTLSFEMLFYYAVFLVLLTRDRRLAASSICMIFIILSICSQFSGSPLIKFLGNPIIFEFLMGVGIALWCTRLPKLFYVAAFSIGVTWLLLAAAFGFGGIMVDGTGIDDAHNTVDASLSFERVLLWGLPSALLVLGVVGLEKEGRRRHKLYSALVYLGGASYSIYLIHPTVFRMLGKMHMAFLPADVILFAGVAAAIVAGALVFQFVEKPLLRMMMPGRRKVVGQEIPLSG